jgi:predicted ABC-type exoprotein transport system permease subunit
MSAGPRLGAPTGMQRVVSIRILDSVSRERLAEEWRRAATQPNWVARVVLLAIFLIVVVPLLLAVGLIALGAIVVIGGVALLRAGIERLRRRFRGDGRSNVRVIRRDE